MERQQCQLEVEICVDNVSIVSCKLGFGVGMNKGYDASGLILTIAYRLTYLQTDCRVFTPFKPPFR